MKLRRMGDLVEYVAKDERGQDNPTVWVFQPLSARIMASINDKAQTVTRGDESNSAEIELKANDAAYRRVEASLVSVQDLYDASGTPILVPDNATIGEVLDMLPIDILLEFAEFVSTLNHVPRDTAKK